MSAVLPRSPSRDQVEILSAQVLGAAERAVAGWGTALAHAKDWQPGFPTGGSTSPPPPPPPPRGDDDEEDDGPVTGTIVERLALSDARDPSQDARDFLDQLQKMAAAAYKAATLLDRLAPALYEGDAEPGCKNDHAGHEPLHRGPRCRWCYGYWSEFGTDPPKGLLERRDQGERITEAMVKAALLAALPSKKVKKRAKRRAA